MITDAQDAAFRRVHAAHIELAIALKELHMVTMREEGVPRCTALAQTWAESSFNWCRSAADRMGVQFPAVRL